MKEETSIVQEEDNEYFPTLEDLSKEETEPSTPFSFEEEETTPSAKTEAQPTSKQTLAPTDFAKHLEQTFGWENVPKDIDPVKAIGAMSDMYEEELNTLRNQLKEATNNAPSDELVQYNKAFETFKALDKKQAVINHLMSADELTQEEAEEEAAELELEGKLERTYTKLYRTTEKEYKKEVEAIDQTIARNHQLREQQEELAYKEEIANFSNILIDFKSEYLAVTDKDKSFLKDAFLEQDNEGYSLVDKMLDDKKTLIEMVIAYYKMQDIAGMPARNKKQVASEMVNSMSNEPLFNQKSFTSTDVLKDYWRKEEEEEY